MNEDHPKPSPREYRQLGCVTIGMGIGAITVGVALWILKKVQPPWTPLVAGALLIAFGAWAISKSKRAN